MFGRTTIIAALATSLTWACALQAGGPGSRAHVADASQPGLSIYDAVQAARIDAARRTGLEGESLILISAESVTWSDASLGCPQPGMVYTQALVPGFRIRIKARGKTLDYHAGARGVVLLCPPERSRDPLPGDSRI